MKFFLPLVLLIILYGHPVLGQHPDFGGVDFSKADSVALSYTHVGDLNPEKIAKDLVKNFSDDVQKFRVIFRWITENIAYDVKLYEQLVYEEPKGNSKQRRNWLLKTNKAYEKNLLRNRSSVCQGYAWLLETMCESIGINCQYISGYARINMKRTGAFQPNHAWNAVKLNGKWYLSDPTWSAGYTSGPPRLKYFKKFSDTYFLTEPGLFIANHYPSDPQWIFLTPKPSLQAFFDSPIKEEGFIANKINSYSPLNGNIKVKNGEVIKFDFTSNKNIKSIIIEASGYLDGKFWVEDGYKEFIQTKEGAFQFSQTFRKGTSFFEVYINKQLAFVYFIKT